MCLNIPAVYFNNIIIILLAQYVCIRSYSHQHAVLLCTHMCMCNVCYTTADYVEEHRHEYEGKLHDSK